MTLLLFRLCQRFHGTVEFKRHFLFSVVCWRGTESQAEIFSKDYRKPAKSTWPPQVGQNYYPAAWPKPSGHLECADNYTFRDSKTYT